MKRILLILCLLFTLVTQAQRTVAYTDKISIGHWNNMEEDWIWELPVYSELAFTIQGNSVMVNDRAESTYKLLDLVAEETNFSMWTALDETNKACRFVINVVPPETISVMYDDVIYVYQISYVD
jgi:hypothetical protein